MAFATMNASPPRTCRMRNAPPEGNPHEKCSPGKGIRMRNAPPPGKGIRMRNAPPGKGNPHEKCSPGIRKRIIGKRITRKE